MYIRGEELRNRIKCSYAQGVYDGLCYAVIIVAALSALGIAALWMVGHGR